MCFFRTACPDWTKLDSFDIYYHVLLNFWHIYVSTVKLDIIKLWNAFPVKRKLFHTVIFKASCPNWTKHDSFDVYDKSHVILGHHLLTINCQVMYHEAVKSVLCRTVCILIRYTYLYSSRFWLSKFWRLSQPSRDTGILFFLDSHTATVKRQYWLTPWKVPKNLKILKVTRKTVISKAILTPESYFWGQN